MIDAHTNPTPRDITLDDIFGVTRHTGSTQKLLTFITSRVVVTPQSRVHARQYENLEAFDLVEIDRTGETDRVRLLETEFAVVKCYHPDLVAWIFSGDDQ